jgi:hypothetical protein
MPALAPFLFFIAYPLAIEPLRSRAVPFFDENISVLATIYPKAQRLRTRFARGGLQNNGQRKE